MRKTPEASFRRRARAREKMDDPSSDRRRLLRTVRQFGLINLLFSRSRLLLRHRFLPRMLREPRRRWRLLDIGAGGCDLDRWLVRACRRRGLRLSVTCLDHDPRIVRYARRACRRYPEIRVIHGSSAGLERLGRFDFILCSNLLHHLPEDQVPGLLRRVLAQCGSAFLICDVRRSRTAWLAFAFFAGAFLHGGFARYDGLLSIRRAFREDELERRLSGVAPPAAVRLFRRVPARLCLYGRMNGRMNRRADGRSVDEPGAAAAGPGA